MNFVQNSIYIIFTSFSALFESQKFGEHQPQAPVEKFSDVVRVCCRYLKDTSDNKLSIALTLVIIRQIQRYPTTFVKNDNFNTKKKRPPLSTPRYRFIEVSHDHVT